MKILAPFNSMDYLDALVEAGAEEFYMGFGSEEWSRRFGRYSDINRLTLFKETANRYELEDIREITRQVHERNCSLYITLNAPGYHRDELYLLEQYLKTLNSYGVDGIITSVPELIGMIRVNGMKAVASTMCGIQNSDLAKWYQNAGIQRVIFPREMTSGEIAAVMETVPELEYEVFLMRNGCRYSDGNCLGLHGGELGALCHSLRSGTVKIYGRPEGIADFGARLDQAHRSFSGEFHEFTCGQCAIFRFLKMGISALKIVGRLDDAKEVVRDVELTRNNLEIAKSCVDEVQYLNNMQLPGDFQEYCRHGMSCYYPEVRWN